MKNIILFGCLLLVCGSAISKPAQIPVIVDTDANNELDDQHALAYLFFNSDIFDIKGITVNATYCGGGINEHYNEAKRVIQLCGVWEKYPLKKGADKSFDEILPEIDSEDFDGCEAVDFIIEKALEINHGKLVLVPIGKMTNIALAIKKEPKIKDKLRIVWLGSNFPKSGEYNLINDISALNYVLNQDVPFEMVVVRYGELSGSDAVRVTPSEINNNMENTGPKVPSVEGRHGGQFTNFGDYSINLFSKIKLHGNPPSRALFDVVALAILKNPTWGESRTLPAPHFIDGVWQERPNNSRKIIIWENFDKKSITEDFWGSMKKANQCMK